jgi:ABC-2 type transport system ATP-binding protein
LNQGELIASGSEDEISANLSGTYRIMLGARMASDTRAEDLVHFVQGLPDITSVEMVQQDDQLLTLLVQSPTDCRGSLSRSLVKSGHDLVRLELGSNELESLFVELLGQKVN